MRNYFAGAGYRRQSNHLMGAEALQLACLWTASASAHSMHFSTSCWARDRMLAEFARLWRGELRFARAFWGYSVAYGLTINLLLSGLSLVSYVISESALFGPGSPFCAVALQYIGLLRSVEERFRSTVGYVAGISRQGIHNRVVRFASVVVKCALEVLPLQGRPGAGGWQSFHINLHTRDNKLGKHTQNQLLMDMLVGLKIRWRKLREGSSPSARTTAKRCTGAAGK